MDPATMNAVAQAKRKWEESAEARFHANAMIPGTWEWEHVKDEEDHIEQLIHGLRFIAGDTALTLDQCRSIAKNTLTDNGHQLKGCSMPSHHPTCTCKGEGGDR